MHAFFDLDGTLTDPKEATYMARLVPNNPVHFHHPWRSDVGR